MPIAVSEDHEELRRGVRRWAERHCPSEVPRAHLDREDDSLPSVWDDLAAQGWLGIHVPEDLGGQGFGVLELAVVVEELGRVLMPGPFLPTALAAAVLARGSDPALAKTVLPGIVDGSTPACVAIGPALSGPSPAAANDDGSITVSGEWPAVLGAGVASLFVLPVRVGESVSWCAVDLTTADRPATGVTVVPRPCLDPTRRSAMVVLDAVPVPSRFS